MSSKSDFNTPVIALVGVVATILTVAIILAVHVLYYSATQRQYENKVIAAGTAESDTKVAEQEAKLTRYAWSDKANGVTVIPIDRAMELVVEEAKHPNERSVTPAPKASEPSANESSETTAPADSTGQSDDNPANAEAPKEEQSDEG